MFYSDIIRSKQISIHVTWFSWPFKEAQRQRLFIFSIQVFYWTDNIRQRMNEIYTKWLARLTSIVWCWGKWHLMESRSGRSAFDVYKLLSYSAGLRLNLETEFESTSSWTYLHLDLQLTSGMTCIKGCSDIKPRMIFVL